MSTTRDTVAWLNARLSEPWSSLSVTSFLTKEIMQSIHRQFILLSAEIKLRLLISVIGLRRHQLKELDSDIKELCHLAMNDDDDWVRAMGGFISTFADRGIMAFDELLKNKYFAEIYFSLKDKMVKETTATFYPLDYAFLDPSLVSADSASIAQKNAHFTVKKATPRMPPRASLAKIPAAAPPTAARSLPKPPPLARSSGDVASRPAPAPSSRMPIPKLQLSTGDGIPRPRIPPKKTMMMMTEDEEEELLKEKADAERMAKEKKEQERLEKQKQAEERHKHQQDLAEEARAAKKRKREEKEALQLIAKRQKKGDSKAFENKESKTDDEMETAPSEEQASKPQEPEQPAAPQPVSSQLPIAPTAPAALSSQLSNSTPVLTTAPVALPGGLISVGLPMPATLSKAATVAPQPAETVPPTAPSAVAAATPAPGTQKKRDPEFILSTIFAKANRMGPATKTLIEDIVCDKPIDLSKWYLPQYNFTLHQEFSPSNIPAEVNEESVVFEWKPREKFWALQHRTRRVPAGFQALAMPPSINPALFTPAAPAPSSSAAMDLQRLLEDTPAPSRPSGAL